MQFGRLSLPFAVWADAGTEYSYFLDSAGSHSESARSLPTAVGSLESGTKATPILQTLLRTHSHLGKNADWIQIYHASSIPTWGQSGLYPDTIRIGKILGWSEILSGLYPHWLASHMWLLCVHGRSALDVGLGCWIFISHHHNNASMRILRHKRIYHVCPTCRLPQLLLSICGGTVTFWWYRNLLVVP